jgi:hypothetical protein
MIPVSSAVQSFWLSVPNAADDFVISGFGILFGGVSTTSKVANQANSMGFDGTCFNVT